MLRLGLYLFSRSAAVDYRCLMAPTWLSEAARAALATAARKLCAAAQDRAPAAGPIHALVELPEVVAVAVAEPLDHKDGFGRRIVYCAAFVAQPGEGDLLRLALPLLFTPKLLVERTMEYLPFPEWDGLRQPREQELVFDWDELMAWRQNIAAQAEPADRRLVAAGLFGLRLPESLFDIRLPAPGADAASATPAAPAPTPKPALGWSWGKKG